MIAKLTELGRRMALSNEVAARNIASDMLAGEALAEWLSLYPALPVSAPRNVLVIMAGNIPFVGIHDLICVLAAGHRAIVKPSSKDFENMSWAVSQLLDIDPNIPLSVSDFPPDTPPDAVIAMGGNAAVTAIAERYVGKPMLLRGNRSSPAILDGSETPDDLAGLADDVLTCSGLGCRNVSLVFVPRGYDFSELQNAVSQRKNDLELKYCNNCAHNRAMLRMAAIPHLDAGVCLLVEKRDFSSEPSVLNYAYYNTEHEVSDWLDRHDEEIQCVATNNFQPAGVDCAVLTRAVRLGQTQRPTLTDYPDGRDTMQFLMTI